MASFADPGQQQMHQPGRQVLVAGLSGFAMPHSATLAIESSDNVHHLWEPVLLQHALPPGCVMCQLGCCAQRADQGLKFWQGYEALT